MGGHPPQPPARGLRPLDPRLPVPVGRGFASVLVPLVAGLKGLTARPFLRFCGGTLPLPPARGFRPPWTPPSLMERRSGAMPTRRRPTTSQNPKEADEMSLRGGASRRSSLLAGWEIASPSARNDNLAMTLPGRLRPGKTFGGVPGYVPELWGMPPIFLTLVG